MRRFILCLTVFASLAAFAQDENGNGYIKKQPRDRHTSEPDAVVGTMPMYWVTIDLRRPAFSFNPNFISPEVPTPVVPKDWGVKIIMQDELDSTCSNQQLKNCKTACMRQGKTLVSCDAWVEWQPDGTAARYYTCGCASPNDPKIAGTVAQVTEIKLVDDAR